MAIHHHRQRAEKRTTTCVASSSCTVDHFTGNHWNDNSLPPLPSTIAVSESAKIGSLICLVSATRVRRLIAQGKARGSRLSHDSSAQHDGIVKLEMERKRKANEHKTPRRPATIRHRQLSHDRQTKTKASYRIHSIAAVRSPLQSVTSAVIYVRVMLGCIAIRANGDF